MRFAIQKNAKSPINYKHKTPYSNISDEYIK